MQSVITQIRQRVHGDAAHLRPPDGRTQLTHHRLHDEDVPERPTQGATPEHAAVPARLHTHVASVHIRGVRDGAGLAPHRALLRLSDHTRPG